MIKHTITFTGFDGQQHTEDFYFNLSMIDAAELETEYGIEKTIREIAETSDTRKAVQIFKIFIEKSIGTKTSTGDFLKIDSFRDAFMQSPACDQLFVDLITNPTVASDFINGVVPTEMLKALAQKTNVNQTALPLPGDETPKTPKPLRDCTTDELRKLPKDEFDRLFEQEKHPVPKHVLVVAMERSDK